METIKNLEKVFKGLANRRRLAIIRFLSQKKEATVGDIAECIHLSFKATSKHLAILRQIDIVDSRQQSLNVYYRLSNSLPSVVKNVFKHISNSCE